jgi:RNA polymerase subunit RPABC4/transcription elongation factor Spt4
MAFLDGIGKKLSQTGQDVMKKTRNLADSTKFSGMIADEERTINSLYSQIGKAYYELHKNDPEYALSELVGAVNDAFARIEQLNEQIAAINGSQKCPRCGAMVPEGGMFCNACGAKMPPKAAVELAAAATVRCTNCGSQIPGGQRFCIYCGSEVVQPSAPKTKICGNCGRELEENAAFCTGCGGPV